MVFAHSEIQRIAAAGVVTDVIHFRSTARPDLLLRRIRAMRARIRQFEPDIVHAHFGTITAFATVIAASVPTVITFRGSDLNPAPSDGPFRNLVQKTLSNTAAVFADAVILVSRQLQSRLWVRHRNAHVIPTGIDLDVFHPLSRAEAREHLAWDFNDHVILFNAGLSPRVKRLDLAERSLEELRRSMPGVRMHVLDGTTPHDLLPLYMNAADCLFMTSDYEGSPDIIKEALASNLPIVSVDAGDVRERTAGVRGVAIVERDPRAIASAAHRILESAQRSNGREHVGALDSNFIRDAVIGVYRTLLERRP